MRNLLGTLGIIAAVILGFMALSYGCAMFDVELEGEVKEEQVENRYEAHEGSQGTIQTLQNVRRNYLKADNEAMRGALRQEAINAANRIDDADVVVGHHTDTEYVVPTNAPVRKGTDRFFRP